MWKHGTIVPKTTWVGALEGMQYYATVSAGYLESSPEGIFVTLLVVVNGGHLSLILICRINGLLFQL